MTREKQKEQKPVEPSDDELQRHQDELYDFKVFAAKQAREHHISFVHDFEWNNFCCELLSYFAEQKPAEWSEEDEDMFVSVLHFLNTNRINERGKVITWVKSLPKRFSLQPKQEWSEEDEKMRNALWNLLKIQYAQDYSMTGVGIEAGKFRDWLKSIRPQPRWKPSEEQMKALQNAVALTACDKELARLYDDLKKLL